MSPGWSSSALSPWIHRGDLSTSHPCSVQCRCAWPDTGGCGPTMGHLATADGKGLGLRLSACLWSGFVPGCLSWQGLVCSRALSTTDHPACPSKEPNFHLLAATAVSRCLFGRGTRCPCTGLTFPLHKARGEHYGLNSSYKYSCTQKALTLWSFLPAKCHESRSNPTTNDMLPNISSCLSVAAPLSSDIALPTHQIQQGAIWVLLLRRNSSTG